MKKVILAYSGGLDTSVIAHWLVNKGYSVICFCADVGQNTESFEIIQDRAMRVGVSKVVIKDLKEQFIEEFIFPSIQMHAAYEGEYLLGTSLARPLIAKKQIELAENENADTVANGTTIMGTCGIRFEMTYSVLNPDIKVLVPWRTKEFLKEFNGRTDLINYAKKHNIAIKQSMRKNWSSDENMMHKSFEAGDLENPWNAPRDDMFELTNSIEETPNTADEIVIEFEKGIPVSINEIRLTPLQMMLELNRLGKTHGIGRVDIVESRFGGIKQRCVYESPGGTILLKSHNALEAITLDHGVIQLKNMLMPRFSEIVFNGFWYSLENEIFLAMLKESQKYVSGFVRLKLYKGNCIICGRKSDTSLYDKDIATMDGNLHSNPSDYEGFIKFQSLALRTCHKRKNK